MDNFNKTNKSNKLKNSRLVICNMGLNTKKPNESITPSKRSRSDFIKFNRNFTSLPIIKIKNKRIPGKVKYNSEQYNETTRPKNKPKNKKSKFK